MKTNLLRGILLIIILAAAFLRLYKLGSIPPHLTPDEASLGYNAYSILKTGKDEYGQFLPIIFKSFGDYKPGLYIYTAVPFVGILGLNEFAVRFPSALAGIIAVGLIFLITKRLFADNRLAAIASLLLTINPWHILFSRGAWEINLALTLTLAGIFFFLKALEKEKFLVISAVFFASTLLAYQGAKLATGLVVLILLVLFWKKLFRFNKINLLLAVAFGLLISSPISLSVLQGKVGRLAVFSVFTYRRPSEYLQAFLDQGNETPKSLTYFLFHSETLNFTRGILGRYMNHFSDRFLFFEGDWQNPRHSIPNHGMLLLADLVLLVVGFVALVRHGVKKESLLVWLWLFLAPLPAALSRDQVHAVRTFNMVVPLVMLFSFGMKEIWLGKKIWKVLFLLIYSASFVYFLDAYFVHLPKHDSQYWEYGYKQIVETVTPIQKNYKMVRVQQSYAQPYIYFLFFQKYDPAKYQQQAKLTPSEIAEDVGKVEHLDNIYFGPIDWSINRGDKDTLFVADTIRIPPADSSDEKLFRLVREIKYLNGRDIAFRIIEVK